MHRRRARAGSLARGVRPRPAARPGRTTGRYRAFRLRKDLPAARAGRHGATGGRRADAAPDPGAQEALETTGLLEKAGLRASELDKADLHRLLLARELAAGPPLPFLDDPHREAGAAPRGAMGG